MLRWFRAARRILSWMTVLPVGTHGAVARPDARRTITCLPWAGAVVGGISAFLGWALVAAGATPLLAGAATVLAGALLTRGMHLDGLADTVDALASYSPPDKAREIMRSGPVGPLGASAVVLVALVEAAAFAQLLGAGLWWVIAVVGVVSRGCAVWLCRRGVPAAPGGGFAPLVAATQGPAALACVGVLLLGAAGAAGACTGGITGTGRAWLGLAATGAVALILLGVLGFGRHAVRRLGGISGDVLGATIAATEMLSAAAFAVLLAASV